MAEAAKFSESRSYTAGEYCLKDGYLYRFTANHSGAWDEDDIERVDTDIGTEVSIVLQTYRALRSASDFAESLVFEPSLIEGTRYKYTLTN